MCAAHNPVRMSTRHPSETGQSTPSGYDESDYPRDTGGVPFDPYQRAPVETTRYYHVISGKPFLRIVMSDGQQIDRPVSESEFMANGGSPDAFLKDPYVAPTVNTDPNAALATGTGTGASGFNGYPTTRIPPTPATTQKPRQPVSRGPAVIDELGQLTASTRPQAVSRPPPGLPSVQVTTPPPGEVDKMKELMGVGADGTPSAPTDPATGAPQVSRQHIDKLLDPLNRYANEIAFLGRDNTGLSEAEAQLNKAHELARQRNADLTRSSQAGALGAARGARNRGDRALLERQAIGEQSYLGSEAQRQQQNADNQLGLDLAILRAKEEDYDRNFRLDALKTAASLGLNTAALELDIEKINVAERSQALNRELEELLANNAINEQQFEALLASDDRKMQAMLGFTQAMAAIQYEYDKLEVTDQQFTDQLLMDKYGIDQQTMVALKQIKEEGKFQWDQVLAGVAGGVGSGLTGGLFSLLSPKKAGGTS